MAWIIRKAGVTKTFPTNWLTTWLTSYATNWSTTWNSSYITYQYQSTGTTYTQTITTYVGEGPVISGQNSEGPFTQNTTYNVPGNVASNQSCFAAGNCNEVYEAYGGSWQVNCPSPSPAPTCGSQGPNIYPGYNVNGSTTYYNYPGYGNAPSILSSILYSVTYFNYTTNYNQVPVTNSTTWNSGNYNYAPGPLYSYNYSQVTNNTSTLIASNNTTAFLSQNTSRNTSINTSQNTSRITQ